MSTEDKHHPSSPAGRGPGMFGGGPQGMAMIVQKPKNFKSTLMRLLVYFRPYWLRLLLVLIATILGTVFSIISPKIMGDATTDLFDGIRRKLLGMPGGGVNFQQIGHLVWILGGLYLFSSLFNYFQQYVMAGVAQRAVYDLRKQVNEKLTKLPISYFDKHPHGEIMSRFVNDFDNISSTLQQSLTQLIQAVITFLGVIVMMLTISPLMTLTVVITLPLSIYVTRTIAVRSQAYFLSRQRRLGELNGHIEEMYTGHLIVKAYGNEDKALTKFDEINERLYDASWKAQFITGIIMPLMNFIGNIGYVLVSVIGGILVIRRRIQIGDILAFIQYARQFTQPITQLSSISNVIQSTIASSERVFEILDEPEQVDDVQDTEVLTHPRGHIQFEHVSFRYQPDTPLIEDMNLEVRPGETVAIVGPTGAGKTTLVNLMMRFYELTSGRILIDGIDITQISRDQLHHLFGMVLQDTWLFNGTIRDNIGYGREGATDAEIVEAAKAAQADHFIRTLPEGYDTVLNEEASNISQGQKQLLTIARAILADPAILILDEATSSVDTRTEILIQQAMDHLMQGRTSFVIAHRLSTIQDADVILVMNHGKVVEQGTHEQLLALKGFYAELYNSQFKPSSSVAV
ncbi:ABC transporter [Sulfobacillus thermotolerans]|uniref:ABC transporter n=1 Tax=Sulfobacillus thermotolerans TaxID=338644 RepID=A0ABM6RRM6_9FIRM|nr:ABC transporter [Sulfobacillus thermotolerans]